METTIQYTVHDHRFIVKIAGDVRHPASPALNSTVQLAEKLLRTDSSITGITIDLDQARFIDSTTLGLLAKLARICQANHRSSLLYTRNKEIVTLLNNLSFDQIFQITEAAPERIHQWISMPLETPKIKELGAIILDAHQQLLKLGVPQQEQIKRVVDQLMNELNLSANAIAGDKSMKESKP